ncbi:quaternary ammonium compound-resistance protein SugE [Loktanella fryxellensis]|uniref:Guanidinium exporter n=1 Tax=Loktanella fryxellensis TaxID=245187 RepID=A0A1H8CY16_9RHOB|nr:SMR family transporter [Loktanella fryxellensis]SEM99107.1 quaternary ammonium compound-resistance protein SugE [Loktanella fryxellensis]
MAWVILVIAGLLETAWAGLLKTAAAKPGPGIIALTVVLIAASMMALALAMRSLPVGIAYPVWTGIGSVGAVTIGWLFYGEAISLTTLAGLAFLVTGMVLLGLGGNH